MNIRCILILSLLMSASAGALGLLYGIGAGGGAVLVGYAICLGIAALALRYVSGNPELASDPHAHVSDDFVSSGHQACTSEREQMVLPKAVEAKTMACAVQEPEVRSTSTRAEMSAVQQVLDLDGMAELRTQETVNGVWLITQASDMALGAIEAACLKTLDPSNNDETRVRRWFEIIASLRAVDRRAFPKAELRRSHVAEQQGVSKEQVRQIDQGRYAPLNKLLGAIEPAIL